MKKTISMFLAGVSVLATVAPAMAAETSADDQVSDGTIIVEARRKDESLQDVPLTVNAVTAESVQKLAMRDFKDITSVVPGLVITSGNRTTGTVSSLRGLNIDVNSSGSSPAVEFYLNDSPAPSGAVFQSMYDIGQIEVLRGPQGTLRGRASPSGSITITNRRPDMNEWGGYVQGAANHIGTINLQGAVNAPILPGILSLRVAGLFDDNEGSRVSSINNQSLRPSNKTRSLRVSLRATPIDSLELNASYWHLVKNSIIWDQAESAHLATGGTLAAGTTLVMPKNRLAVSNVPNDNHQGFDIFNFQAKYSFLGQRLNYVGSIIKQDFRSAEPSDKGDYFDSTWPGDAALSNNNGTFATLASTLNLQNIAQATHSYTKTTAHELRLSSEERAFGMFDYVIGGFVQRSTPWTDLVQAASANVNPVSKTLLSITPSAIARRGRTIERALFGNLTVHFGDATELSGGARHIDYRTNNNYGTAANPFPATEDRFKAWIWNASLKHRFNDDLMVYANAGSSFRVGSGTNALILSRSVSVANVVDPFMLTMLQITPERSKSYEIGFRSSWLDRRITFNMSAFHQDFDGYIFPISPFFVRNNTGTTAAPVLAAPVLTLSSTAAPVPAKVDGIEAELAVRPTEGLSLSATIAYAKAKMVNATVPCAPPNQPSATEQIAKCTLTQSASRIAPFTASLQGEYSHPINDDLSGFVRTTVSIFGNSSNDPQNPYDDVKSYALANLYAGIRGGDGAWELSLYARNLFNTFRVTERFSTAANIRVNGVTSFSNYRLINVTDPQEFGITARFAIGSR